MSDNKEFLNRVGGAKGCEFIDDAVEHEFDSPIGSIIMGDGGTISSITYTDKDGIPKIDTSNYINKAMANGTLITFQYPVTKITFSAGTGMVYFM